MTDEPTLTDGTVSLHRLPTDASDEASTERFEIRRDDQGVGDCGVRRVDDSTGALTWTLLPEHRGQGSAARAIRVLTDWALTERGQGGLGLVRVEARIDPSNDAALRVASRSGLLREGVRRAGEGQSLVILARLADDPPLNDPKSFRALLNSFLPRKRAIGQMLVRDDAGRVLLCQLTYKTDWDLPGGVVEVGESPKLAVGREVAEELALDITPGDLLLTDWLPPWSGWDDALCLVFDGGVQDAAIVGDIVRQEREIRSAEFCTPEQVDERCADFTARRIRAAMRAVDTGSATYSESGR